MSSPHTQNKQTITEVNKTETNLSVENASDPGPARSASIYTYLKYISLIMFVLQNVIRVTLLRYIKTKQAIRPVDSTFVFICEIQKAIFLIFLIFATERNIINGFKIILKTILTEPYNTMKICIIALVYFIQNNLSLFAVSKLDIATLGVTSQLKILTTAIFSRILLNRRLNVIQLFGLILLFIGISIVEIQIMTSKGVKKDVQPDDRLGLGLGLTAVGISCICSGFAGVYFEKIVKSTDTSLWIYSIQLAGISIILSFLGMYILDGDTVKKNGILYGYTPLVWSSTIINSIGGLTVALVIKYSDTILKGFASSASVVLSCIVAMIYFKFQLTPLFAIGSLLVVFSIIIYSNPGLILSIPIFKLCSKDKPVFV